MRRTIERAGDIFVAIEDVRVDSAISKRNLSVAAGKSIATYWHAQRNGDLRLSTAIDLLRALGLRIEVVRETRQ